ncbi:ASCH domain-containing protein [Streptomyces sp. NPDC058357]|uniref:ASCH domain-containing protein n=1 Tax=unclassified Streptomyces TaxID=2593676 RepID=UPI0036694F48
MTGSQQPAEHSLNLRKPYFDLIASGAKTIEVRVGHSRIRRITADDTLRITCGNESLTTRVTAVTEHGCLRIREVRFEPV